MSELESDELRRACVAAELKVCEKLHNAGWEAGVSFPGVEWRYDDDDPALPSYVASLLVARVREMDPDPGIAKGKDSRQRQLHEAYCRQFKGLPPGYMVATDAQRIRAAYKVITGRELIE